MSIPLAPDDAMDPWLLTAAALQVVAWIAVSALRRANHADPLWRRATTRLRFLLLATAAAGTLLAALGLRLFGAMVLTLIPSLLGILALVVAIRRLRQDLGDRASQ